MYPQIPASLATTNDLYQNPGGVDVAALLKEFSRVHPVPMLEAGATGVTTSLVCFVAPCKCVVTGFKAIKQKVQTGTGNTPEVKLRKGSATELAATGAIALSGAIGDVHEGTLTATTANLTLSKGEVLSMDVINPSATITIAIQVVGQIEWHSVA